MKNVLFVSAVMMMFSGFAHAATSTPNEVEGWSGQQISVHPETDGAATVEMGCSYITLKEWNVDGKPMVGEQSSGLITQVRTFTKVRVIAVLESDGNLKLTIGNGPTDTLIEGFQPSIVCE